jgi:polygalacturonase
MFVPLRPSRFAFVSLLMVFAALASQSALAAGRVCDPAKFGAKADGVTKDTAAIQSAIDDCATHGGGTVTLNKGTYLSAPIVLKDNITLDIETGSTLFGSPDHADYPAKTEFRAPGAQSLVSATNAHNLTITGGGVIDGNGASWWAAMRAQFAAGAPRDPNAPRTPRPFRPRLVVFDHCQHILIEKVTVQNSPSWQIVPYYSDDIIIRNIKVLATIPSPNTDAINPFSSSNITIDHVYADVGDDNIAIKSGQPGSPGPDAPSKNITITDCTFDHGHGLSIGSEIAGGAQNIHAERIHFKGTDNGIRIKANRDRGADVSNISFKDIDMDGVKYPILVSAYYPRELPPDPNPPQPITRLTPFFHDVLIENVTIKNSPRAGAIVGLPESPVKGIVLKNVHIQAAKGMTISDAEVTGENVTIKVDSGKDMDILPSAKVTIK